MSTHTRNFVWGGGFCAILLTLAAASAQATTETLFSDDFEGGDPYNANPYPGMPTAWTLAVNEFCAVGGTWQIGVPSNPHGPGAAHGGTRCASTGLAANTPSMTESWLVSPPTYLPFLEDNGLTLYFWQWRDLSSTSQAQVMVGQVNVGVLYPLWSQADISVSTPYTGPTGGWYYCAVDLTPWRGGYVVLGFKETGAGGDPGWFIDDVALTQYRFADTWNGSNQSFEGGWGLWTCDYGGWDVGTSPGSAAAPPAGATGTAFAGTGLRGAAPVIADSHLISPMIYAHKNAGEVLVLEFSYWSDYGTGGGIVEWSEYVLPAGATIWSWTGFDSIWPREHQTVYGGQTGQWVRARVDLTPIVGVAITQNTLPFRIGFHHYGTGGLGWFIDDVTIRGIAPAPTAAVLHDDVAVPDGCTTPIAFEPVALHGNPPEETFTLQNAGSAALDVQPLELDADAGFEVSAQPSASVAAGESTTFKIRLLTDVAGDKTADVVLRTNDGEAAEYRFEISGTVSAADGADSGTPADGTDGSSTESNGQVAGTGASTEGTGDGGDGANPGGPAAPGMPCGAGAGTLQLGLLWSLCWVSLGGAYVRRAYLRSGGT